MKKFRKFKAEFKNYILIIEEDLPDIGWQMYVYINGKDTYDYNQDTLKICQEEAFEEFGIPMDIWVEIEE